MYVMVRVLMILFRSDGNSDIGSGHIMRCLSIADAIQDNDEKCVFVTSCNQSADFIRSKGYICYSLDSDYRNMDEELHRFIALIEKLHPQRIVIDSYFVTEKYLMSLRELSVIVYIDDLNAFDYPVDMLINYNIYGEDVLYPSGKKYVLGTKYVPLRKEFQNIEVKSINATIKNVLVSTGGADPEHVALMFLKKLKVEHKFENKRFLVLVGGMNRDSDKIKLLAEDMPNVKICKNVTDMRSLMLGCDIAISAAGSTQYELCACGVPTISYVLADNQILGSQTFEKRGIIMNAGDCRDNPFFFEELFRLLVDMEDFKIREKYSKKMRMLVDGKGAARLADSIINSVL